MTVHNKDGGTTFMKKLVALVLAMVLVLGVGARALPR
jgi:hypothetical protein